MNQTPGINYKTDWRLLQARQLIEKKEDPQNAPDIYIQEIMKYITSDNPIPFVSLAFEMFKDTWYRARIEGLVISGVSLKEIGNFFDFSFASLEYYTKIFFDIEPLAGRGSFLKLIEEKLIPREVKEYREMGIRFGEDYLKWKLGLTDTLSEQQRSDLMSKVGDALLIRAVEIDSSEIEAFDKVKTYLELIKTFIKFKSGFRRNDGDDSEDLKIIVEHVCNDRIALPPLAGQITDLSGNIADSESI